MRKILVLSILVGIAGPVAADNKQAEKLFRDLENKLRSAKTLRCRYTATFPAQNKETELIVKGRLLLGEGDKLRWEMDLKLDGSPVRMMLISDGSRASQSYAPKAKPAKFTPEQAIAKTPKDLGRLIRATLTRRGLLSFMEHQDRKVVRPTDALSVSDFRLKGKKKIGGLDTQVFEYTVKEKDRSKWRVIVWLDMQSHLPARLTVETDGQNRSTETYSHFTLDNKVEEKEFEVPNYPVKK
jgi:outer membrane lipoprotein-sorting protein